MNIPPPMFIGVDYGTDYCYRYVLNPAFENWLFWHDIEMQEIAKTFGLESEVIK